MDSLLFPSLAFGVWMPAVVVLQFFAKVAGGAVWAVMVSAFASRTTQGETK